MRAYPIQFYQWKKMKRAFFETPQTVSWDRITKKLPNIFEDLNKVIRQEKNLLS